MGNIIRIKDYIVGDVGNKLYKKLVDFGYYYDKNIDFTKKEFIKFSNLLYDLYVYNNRLYRYCEEYEKIIYVTFLNSIKLKKENIEISDILDSMFDVKSNNFKVNYLKKIHTKKKF